MFLPDDIILSIKEFSKPHYYIGITHPLWRYGSPTAVALRQSILWNDYQEYLDYQWRSILLTGEELTLIEYWIHYVLHN